jgi:hypothetical protein
VIEKDLNRKVKQAPYNMEAISGYGRNQWYTRTWFKIY